MKTPGFCCHCTPPSKAFAGENAKAATPAAANSALMFDFMCPLVV
jgi:hypothetical protein